MFNEQFNRETQTLEALEAKLETCQQNEQWKNFIRHYAVTGDQFFAFANSYSGKDQETIRKGSYAIMAKRSIRDLIAWFLKKTEKEKFIDEIDRVLRSRKPNPSRLRALELKARIMFGVDLKSLSKKSGKSEEATASELPVFDPNAKYEVGTRVMYQNRAIEITAVNSEGRATDYEWAGDPQSPVAW
jgi:hypothetical protein